MLSEFLEDLANIAPLAGAGTHLFRDEWGAHTGFVQIIADSQNQVKIHRIWSLRPRMGHGSAILRTLCHLADRHGIALTLKVLPLGAKPYPLSQNELLAWYERHGFSGNRRKMMRPPLCAVGLQRAALSAPSRPELVVTP